MGVDAGVIHHQVKLVGVLAGDNLGRLVEVLEEAESLELGVLDPRFVFLVVIV